MNYPKTMFPVAVLAAAAIAGVSLARASFSTSENNTIQEQGPTLGPHHGHMKAEEGVWDALVKIHVPNGQAIETKGVETNTIGAGGLWLISDFKGDFAGQPFHGHGLVGYDRKKQKYTGVWVDSMQDFLATFEGTCDGSGKVRTMYGQWPDETGKVKEWKEVVEIKDKDTRTFAMSTKGDDGNFHVIMTIDYKRRK